MSVSLEYPKLPTRRFTKEATDRRLRLLGDIHHAKKAEIHQELVAALSEYLKDAKLQHDIYHLETGDVVAPAGRKLTKAWIERVACAYDQLDTDTAQVETRLRQICQPFRARFNQIDTELEEEETKVQNHRTAAPSVEKMLEDVGRERSQPETLTRKPDLEM